MRFSLQDVKKQVQGRGDKLSVSLHFLRPGELHSEIERLIAYHEQLLGQPHRQCSTDEARAFIGDYRLAHCLINTLSAWYQWRQCPWPDVLSRFDVRAGQLLEEAGISSPVDLRLALFNYVNEQFHGFLETARRAEALQAFATTYQLSVSDLEYLLALDSDEEEILVREAPQSPQPRDVATLYNQWVFEAALCNASQVRFVIDCEAFERAALTTAEQGRATARVAPTIPTAGIGVGAVIKRLCYLARLLGVYYDLAYEPALPQTALRLHLTLYGPQEMTGAPQQYGMRLARLCRLLLGYDISQRRPIHNTAGRAKQHSALGSTRALNQAIVEAEATVHFLQRSYCFAINQHILSLLPPDPALNQAEPPASTAQPFEAVSSVFDSSIEQSFAEAFTSLENSSAVDGWQLLREPEPLLLAQSIFIPDFALTRAGQRIYVEILGFWTPAYRERKIQKLQQLQSREDIVLAIPSEARTAFQSVAEAFPIAWYEGQLSVSELLTILRSHCDNLAERLALIDVAEVRKRVESAGLLPERTCYDLLHCYRRSELPLAAERVVDQQITFAAGIGLYHGDWMEQLRNSFVEWIGYIGASPLTDVLRECKTRWPVLAQCEDATIEAVLGLWSEVQVRRNSIFDAVVELANPGGAQLIAPDNGMGSATVSNPGSETVASKKPPREKRTAQKKRVVREVAQGDLWG